MQKLTEVSDRKKGPPDKKRGLIFFQAVTG